MSDAWAQIYQGELKDRCLPSPEGRAGLTPAVVLGQEGKVWQVRTKVRTPQLWQIFPAVPENSSVTLSTFCLCLSLFLSQMRLTEGGFVCCICNLRAFSGGCCVSPVPLKLLSSKAEWEFDRPQKEKTFV